ncbi:DUF945 family protein [Motilimonas pumila]|uniref:DUF945 family protein n=1 Tax=Motilimonas pumila TaxID=2303987 RepID=A0A418YAB9_9GAMM|nr:DUF945 family protein [Motilimonas pumila]RJG39492.1 DUF945 family protein [Motilimonas pumila]
MKKSLIAAAVVAATSLGATYYVGQYTQEQTELMIAQLNAQDAGVIAKIVSYDKTFLSAKANIELTMDQPDLTSEPVVMVVQSDIKHFPYKAEISSVFSLANEELNTEVQAFFGTPTPLTSNDSVNILGQWSGVTTLAAINYEDQGDNFKSSPLNFTYQVDLNSMKGESGFDLASLEVNSIYNVKLSELNAKGHFEQIQDTALFAYDYKLSLASSEVRSIEGDFDMANMVARVALSKGNTDTTMASVLSLDIDDYKIVSEENLAFSKVGLEVNVDNIDQASLAALAQLQENPDNVDETLIQQVILQLLNKGVDISISRLASTTPWGEVDANVKLTVPADAINEQVLVNGPQSALPVLKGEAKASLPAAMLSVPQVGQNLNMALIMGILQQNEDKLTLDGALQEGVLTVNGKTIPLM